MDDNEGKVGHRLWDEPALSQRVGSTRVVPFGDFLCVAIGTPAAVEFPSIRSPYGRGM